MQVVPYQGSKRRLAPQISQYFPTEVETFYEPFAGSAALTLYAAEHDLARRFVIGDALTELVDLWRAIVEDPSRVARQYRSIWSDHDKTDHYNKIREEFNTGRDPVHLLYLIARCVKNAVRFNQKNGFSQSADTRRKGVHPDTLEKSVNKASALLRNRTTFYAGDFMGCLEPASSADLVFMDPPYQGTTYGRDRRYAYGLERSALLGTLGDLNRRDVAFLLTYDGSTGEKLYGEALPIDELSLQHVHLSGGRSSQSTLSGRNEATIESLYVSKRLQKPEAAMVESPWLDD